MALQPFELVTLAGRAGSILLPILFPPATTGRPPDIFEENGAN